MEQDGAIFVHTSFDGTQLHLLSRAHFDLFCTYNVHGGAVSCIATVPLKCGS